MSKNTEIMAVLSVALIAGRTLEKYMHQGRCPEDAELQELVKVRFQIHALMDHLNRPTLVVAQPHR